MINMEHFILRTKALIIDFIIVTLLTALVDNIIFMILVLLKLPVNIYSSIVLVIITMAYFTIFEAKTNKTIGKKVMHLYVSDIEGYMSYKKAFIRNLTKIYWIPLIFDVLIGKILNYPSRLFDKLAKTDVYADTELEVTKEEDTFEELTEDDFEELDADEI